MTIKNSLRTNQRKFSLNSCAIPIYLPIELFRQRFSFAEHYPCTEFVQGKKIPFVWWYIRLLEFDCHNTSGQARWFGRHAQNYEIISNPHLVAVRLHVRTGNISISASQTRMSCSGQSSLKISLASHLFSLTFHEGLPATADRNLTFVMLRVEIYQMRSVLNFWQRRVTAKTFWFAPG
jgi:hypothetical protein